jgi:hypothetical protein
MFKVFKIFYLIKIINKMQNNKDQKQYKKIPVPESSSESDEEYEVEKILDKRYNKYEKCYEYLIRWSGYGP